jgi:pimeloyl-ACP methyl ester carboxylesterase
LSNISEHLVEIDGCPIHVRRAGTGQDVLYLHGAQGMGAWSPFFERLAASSAVCVPDHPGFGRSQPRGLVEIVADLAYVYLDFIEKTGMKNVHVVGHCIGGWVAMEMAVRSPSSIGRLTLLNSAGIHVAGVPMGDFFMATSDRLPDLLFADPVQGRELLAKEQADGDDMTVHANRVMAARLSWAPRLFDPALERWLRRISAPTSVIWAKSNRILPLPYGEALAKLIPNARLTVLDGCGHLAHLEQPIAVADAILNKGRLA